MYGEKVAARNEPQPQQRTPLNRERVLQSAVALADRDGIEAVTMRNLASELGVEAMSLYYHVANKETLLDGMVDVLVGEINKAVAETEIPDPSEDWKTALRKTILTARAVMLRHTWAPSVIESRTTFSPTLARYFDGVLGIMRGGGFSYDLGHHAMHALGSRALGFTQELFQPDDVEADDAASREMMAEMASELPNLIGMLADISHDDPGSTLGWCDDQTEFEFGLDLILDGLARRLDAD